MNASPHAPRLTVGIVGAGQLARMMVQAAIPLGITVRLLAATADDSAALVWPNVLVGSPDSLDALRELAASCDVVTFDHELVDPGHLAALEAEGYTLRPSATTALFAQDKGYQRARFHERGFPVPPHRFVESMRDITEFARAHGWPLVAKSRRGGYDGRGVWVVPDEAAAARLLDETRASGVTLLVEQFLRIERELAVLVARRPGGEAVVYPVVQTVQVDGICHEVHAPAPVSAALAAEAEQLGRAVADAIDVSGILAVELFVVEGRLVVNELAVRPHNSGHFSIEGSATSQFENHLRAVLDLPLGGTAMRAPVAVMANVLGGREGRDPRAALADALAVEGAHVHLYGKGPRPGRKLGHVTVVGDCVEDVRARAVRAAGLLVAPPAAAEARS
jgi:5-(carboxyamino)imidazole ribonucleotide synthase